MALYRIPIDNDSEGILVLLVPIYTYEYIVYVHLARVNKNMARLSFLEESAKRITYEYILAYMYMYEYMRVPIRTYEYTSRIYGTTIF